MTLHLKISRRAVAEIERADNWWVQNRPAAPGAIGEDLRAVFALLLREPGVGATVANARLRGVRRLHLGRVRYYLYYRVNGNAVEVLAFWHSSRGASPRL